MRFRNQVQQQPETLFVVLRLLYGMKPRHQRWLYDASFLQRQGVAEDDRELILEQGQNLLDTLNWIGQEDDQATFPKRFRLYDFQFGSPLVLLRRCAFRTMYKGPGEGLRDCSFEEFMFADKAYRDGDLPRLAAILYRPRVHDERVPLDRSQVEARTRLFGRLDPALLERIAFSYSCTLSLLQRIFKYVFLKSQPSDVDKKPSGNWLDVAIGMAKLDVTKIREIEQINVYLALKVLNEQSRQAEEMEKEIEKMKRK